MRTASLARTKAGLERVISGWRERGLSVGLVPTMGALHAGHAALIRRAAAECDRVLVSIFVNPLQFAPHEDYGRYPRALPADRQLACAAGAHAVYAPSPAAMCPADFKTSVEVSGLSGLYCGEYRPGHFRGVATVVLKLLNQARPDRAYFGEKDYQQVLILEAMVRDLDVPVRIVRVPTVREHDGLALSSRNAYLTAEERAAAPALRAALLQGRRASRRLGARPADIAAAVRRALRGTGLRLQYAAMAGSRLLAAAYLGRTRLIDNLHLKKLRSQP